jgi:hypothetical protein
MKLMVKPFDFREIENLLDEGKKIAAIKHLRKSCVGIEQLGLREAKDAVENMAGHGRPNAPTVMQSPFIKRIVVDMGDGEVTIDLETMELLVLKDVERLGLESCGQMLDFVHTIKAWSEGCSVGVIEPNEGG